MQPNLVHVADKDDVAFGKGQLAVLAAGKVVGGHRGTQEGKRRRLLEDRVVVSNQRLHHRTDNA